MPALTDDLKVILLGAIETNTLVVLCGAGLSVPLPSGLPGAIQVARACYDRWLPTEALDPALRDDVDKLAGHFHAKGQFDTNFIKLVPWGELMGIPNKGHAAIADLLISRGAHGALSANFDTMIERWAQERKLDFQGALTGQEAVDFNTTSNPLLKFHGCMTRAKHETLWTKGQLAEPAIQSKIESCSQWITQNLPGKHLVVVGFWTDWGYLNDVLANAFTINTAASVTVVDPSPTPDLNTKAPDLWAKLNALSAKFEHVAVSGADFLDEVRIEYSKSWLAKFYQRGASLATAVGITSTPSASTLGGEELYNLRQDAQGVPYHRAATLKEPSMDAAQASLMHFELAEQGATREGPWLRHAGKTIRVINGAGRELAELKGSYREPSSVLQSDVVICAGAIKLGTPARIIASGSGMSIVKSSPGGGSNWLTREEAHAALGL